MDLVRDMYQRFTDPDNKITAELQTEARCREALAERVEETNHKVQDLTERLEKLGSASRRQRRGAAAAAVVQWRVARRGAALDRGHHGMRKVAGDPNADARMKAT